MNQFTHRWARVALAFGLAIGLTFGLAACDQQAISELEEGVSTEADVRQRFGAPEAVWDGPDGSQIYEYNRQPAGYQNYQITIGPDGKMAALRQVLTPRNFALIQPGMTMEEVRRMLGKPMKITTFDLKKETHYDWRYQDGPNDSDSKVFTVIFTPDLRVISTMSVRDPDLDRNR
jgi:outer membrane protein assembly factor BamE (lipoprotein component of BamABCDE complex)